jgi:ABC-type sugar transport system ATPase subunit
VSQTETNLVGRPPVVLSARGIDKRYPGIQALKQVDIELFEGEVHGLVGENGAGKSTLVKVLSGVLAPDSGSVTVFGRRLERFGPTAGHRAGVAVVHQEPNVVPALSPVANVFLGQVISRSGLLAEREMRRRFLRWTDELNVDLPTSGPSGTLSIAAQQTIEIIRSLERGSRIVMMDEPTASLGQEEREGLFHMLEIMREQGTAIVFISHKLDDVLRVANTVTVMRDGERVLTQGASSTTSGLLVEAMLGRQLGDLLGHRTTPNKRLRTKPAEVLRVESLRVLNALHGIDLAVSAGEIIGIAGLVGAGRSTVLRSIGGAEPSAEGRMFISGKQVPWPRTPRRAHGLGIALAPEDRRTEGLVMSLSSAANLVLPSLSMRGRYGFSSQRSLLLSAESEAARVGFSKTRLRALAGQLSGGNQQKLVLGKFLPFEPSVLLVDEPTRGIDVGAKAEIFRMLQDLASQGAAVVVVSEELEELIGLADRVVVVREGLVSDVVAGDPDHAERILSNMLPVRVKESGTPDRLVAT